MENIKTEINFPAIGKPAVATLTVDLLSLSLDRLYELAGLFFDIQGPYSQSELMLMLEALGKHGPGITHCKGSWKESFIIYDGELWLYFNIPSGTTLVVKRKIG
jgi:hypothetical protein